MFRALALDGSISSSYSRKRSFSVLLIVRFDRFTFAKSEKNANRALQNSYTSVIKIHR